MTDAIVEQVALIAVTLDGLPTAAEAIVQSIALVCVNVEYEIPISYIPFSAGQFMQTMPYYIGQ